ncbi:TlpA disulfide reductase family protein, partial [Odoribacter splanchnicus]
MNLKELTERYELFPAELQNSLLGQQIKTQIKKMQTLAPGQIAPDFTVQTPDGKSFNLHSIKAKAKIIDFWASWCAPCRALTPQLVKLYNEFHEQGLEIIGISLDDKKEAWIKAIEEENIPWFQGSKLDGFKPDNPLNQLYGIHGIPHIVLLNTDNQIVVTTTDIKILREEILKLFKQ